MEVILTLEIKIAKLEMVIKHRLVSHNTEMLTLLKKATDLEFKQLYESSDLRAKEVCRLINKFEVSFVDIKDIKLELAQYKKEYMSTFDKINKNKNELSNLLNFAIDSKNMVAIDSKNMVATSSDKHGRFS